MKLIPENYKIFILPAFFNYTDCERIRTVISDQVQDFLLVRHISFSHHQTLENFKESIVLCWCENIRVPQLNLKCESCNSKDANDGPQRNPKENDATKCS